MKVFLQDFFSKLDGLNHNFILDESLLDGLNHNYIQNLKYTFYFKCKK
jgi:hypothetical protein